MQGYIIFLIIGIIVLTGYVREKIKGASPLALFLKTVVSTTFFLCALCALWHVGPEAHKGFGYMVTAGLFLGLMGDVWLDLKLVYPETDTFYTYSGFFAFGAGHILFMLGMLNYSWGEINYIHIILPLVIGFAVGAGNALLEKPMGMKYGRFKWIVVLYGGILFSMTVMAGFMAKAFEFKDLSMNLLFAGGVSFVISDLVLSGTFFGIGKDRARDIILNYVFYYGAQFLIASAILFA